MNPTIRRSIEQSRTNAKIIAKHRALISQTVPSRQATDYVFGVQYDRDEPEFVEARNIIFLNKRYE
jgi:hypothetical protein